MPEIFRKISSDLRFYSGLEPPHPSFAGFNVTVGNGLIGAKAGHPVLQKVMELVEERWERLAQKYPGKDGFSRTQIVMERTYLPFTQAVVESIDQPGYRDVVTPAAYFFAKKGIAPVYCKHFYANTWAQGDDHPKRFEQDVQKKLLKVERKYQNVVFFALIALFLNGLGWAVFLQQERVQ